MGLQTFTLTRRLSRFANSYTGNPLAQNRTNLVATRTLLVNFGLRTIFGTAGLSSRTILVAKGVVGMRGKLLYENGLR